MLAASFPISVVVVVVVGTDWERDIVSAAAEASVARVWDFQCSSSSNHNINNNNINNSRIIPSHVRIPIDRIPTIPSRESTPSCPVRPPTPPPTIRRETGTTSACSNTANHHNRSGLSHPRLAANATAMDLSSETIDREVNLAMSQLELSHHLRVDDFGFASSGSGGGIGVGVGGVVAATGSDASGSYVGGGLSGMSTRRCIPRFGVRRAAREDTLRERALEEEVAVMVVAWEAREASPLLREEEGSSSSTVASKSCEAGVP
mmetsp:Transcript_23255/g.50254  ORF Transcript_23255/g.50254 Transcript_23255/m.50254 type:complete len:262 (-) Transcript_23255:725-1510(-)